jgi:hypothetical protein
MSDVNLAFQLQSNSENKDFVANPYIPFPTLTYPVRPDNLPYIKLHPQPMTIARYFDVKTGAKNCFYPSYKSLPCNCQSKVNTICK